MTFGELAIGDTFEFDYRYHKRLWRGDVSAGPWRKVSAWTYHHTTDPLKTEYHVRKKNLRVIREGV